MSLKGTQGFGAGTQGRTFWESGTASPWVQRNEIPQLFPVAPSNLGWFMGRGHVSAGRCGYRRKQWPDCRGPDVLREGLLSFIQKAKRNR